MNATGEVPPDVPLWRQYKEHALPLTTPPSVDIPPMSRGRYCTKYRLDVAETIHGNRPLWSVQCDWAARMPAAICPNCSDLCYRCRDSGLADRVRPAGSVQTVSHTCGPFLASDRGRRPFGWRRPGSSP